MDQKERLAPLMSLLRGVSLAGWFVLVSGSGDEIIGPKGGYAGHTIIQDGDRVR